MDHTFVANFSTGFFGATVVGTALFSLTPHMRKLKVVEFIFAALFGGLVYGLSNGLFHLLIAASAPTFVTRAGAALLALILPIVVAIKVGTYTRFTITDVLHHLAVIFCTAAATSFFAWLMYA